MKNEKINISEAFKHLLDGKKIKHKDSDYIVYQLLDDKITRYKKENNYYNLCFTDFKIDNERLNNWMVVDESLNIEFFAYAGITVPDLIKKGHTLKRLKTGKGYNNTNSFAIEDIEASDWVIEDL